VAGKQGGFQQCDEIAIPAFSGMEEGEVDSQSVSALVRAVAEDELAKNDRVAQGLFRIVIGRWHPVDGKESKEPVVIAVWIQQPLAQIFGFRVMARRFADAGERSIKPVETCGNLGNLGSGSVF
jgi:hypothetical protein